MRIRTDSLPLFSCWFSFLFLFCLLCWAGAVPSHADRVYLKDGTIIQCKIINNTVDARGNRYYQIQIHNLSVWVSGDAVQRTEITPDTGTPNQQLQKQLEELLKAGTAVHQIEEATGAEAGEKGRDVPLTVKEIRGWAYIYENERAVQQGERTVLKVGGTVPLRQLLLISPNSRVTLSIGDIGTMGLDGGTRIRFDTISLSRAQTYEIDLVLSNGRFWVQAGEQGSTWKRINLTMNQVRATLQQATLWVEAAERAGAIDITYLRGTAKLNFWRATETPSQVTVGDRVQVSPASNRLAVEKQENLQPLLDIIQNWNAWQPEPLAVSLDVMVPPLKPYPEYPAIPALHPYKIPIDSSMMFPAETRAQGQIMELYRQAMEKYKYDTGKYPRNEQGLEALLKPKGVGGWRGPYVGPDVPLKDLWGNPYVYELYTVNRKEYADIRSLGPNGQDDKGLGDDVR